MQYIVYEDARKALRLIASNYIEKHRVTYSTVALECAKAIEKMPRQDTVEVPTEATCERTCSVEPFLLRGSVGRDVYRCSRCSQVVGRKDRYCKFCGRRLVDRENQTPQKAI